MVRSPWFFFSVNGHKLDTWLTHSHTMTPFDESGKEAFWKHSGKRRNCLYKQFLPFPQCFLLYQIQKLSFLLHMSSANAFNLVWSKILSCGNGLILLLRTEITQMMRYHNYEILNIVGFLSIFRYLFYCALHHLASILNFAVAKLQTCTYILNRCL